MAPLTLRLMMIDAPNAPRRSQISLRLQHGNWRVLHPGPDRETGPIWSSPLKARGAPWQIIWRKIGTVNQLINSDASASFRDRRGHVPVLERRPFGFVGAHLSGPLRQSVSDRALERAQAITGSEPRRASPRTAAIRTAALTSVAKNMRQKDSDASGGQWKDLSVAHRRALLRGNVL